MPQGNTGKRSVARISSVYCLKTTTTTRPWVHQRPPRYEGMRKDCVGNTGRLRTYRKKLPPFFWHLPKIFLDKSPRGGSPRRPQVKKNRNIFFCKRIILYLDNSPLLCYIISSSWGLRPYALNAAWLGLSRRPPLKAVKLGDSQRARWVTTDSHPIKRRPLQWHNTI